MKNIVIIGGGTGTFTLLSGLRKFPSNNSVIVSSADDGGSTGQLRKELGVFPPGDIRQCLVGLSYTEKEMTDLFSYRFDAGSLAGHTVGNIIIAALEKTTGNIESAISLAGKMLNIRGQVLPVTLEPTNLSAELENGQTLAGEHNIDDQKPEGQPSAIKQLKLSPAAANPAALAAIKTADAIIFGPGDLLTSVLPNVLVSGMKAAIVQSSAKRILVTNIMTKYGQTDGFKASDFAKVLSAYLGSNIDVAIINNKKPDVEWLEKYKEELAEFVEPDITTLEQTGTKVVAEDLVYNFEFQRTSGDKLKRSFLRHDADKTSKIIWELL